MSQTTAAARLHAVLKSAIDGKIPEGKIVHDAWAGVFGTKQGSNKFYSSIAEMQSLVAELARIVKKSESISQHAKNVYLSALNAVGQSISIQRLHLSWRDINQQFLTSNNLDLILLLDDTLRSISPEATLEDEVTQELRKSLLELGEEILKAEMPLDLRTAMQLQIGSLVDCLEHFMLFGMVNLKRRISESLGRVYTDFELYAADYKGPIVRRYFDGLLRILGLVKAAEGRDKSIADLSQAPKLIGFDSKKEG